MFKENGQNIVIKMIGLCVFHAILLYALYLANSVTFLLIVVFVMDIFATLAEIAFESSIVVFTDKKIMGRVSSVFAIVGQSFFLTGVLTYTLIFCKMNYQLQGLITIAPLMLFILIAALFLRKKKSQPNAGCKKTAIQE